MHSLGYFFIVGSLVTLSLPVGVHGQEPSIQDLVDRECLDSVRTHVRILADDTTFFSGDSTSWIPSRYDSAGTKLARIYLRAKLESFGYAVRLDTFGLPEGDIAQVNILAEQPGLDEPDVKVIIGAHYDAVKMTPGADDNASGCAAVLEAARVLSRCKTHCTILYAFWDDEESGRQGSTHYALNARSRGDSIRAVINIDEIGWDSVQTSGGEIWVRPYGQSEALGDSLMLLSQRVTTGITMHRIDPALLGSDHTSFWLKGYSAVSLAEEIYGGNASHYGHTAEDKVEHLNFASLLGRARFAAASIAWLAGFEGPLSVEPSGPIPTSYALHRNYPNPFNPSTTIEYTVAGVRSQGSWVRDVRIVIYDLLGREVALLVNGQKAPGTYTVTFDGSRLASGVYFYRLTAGAYTATKAMVLER